MSEKVAAGVITEYAFSAKCVWVEGLSGPQVPEVTPEQSAALASLDLTENREALADVAAVLVRIAKDTVVCCGHGLAMDLRYPLTRAFMEAARPELPGDELISSSLADWICSHRAELGKSAALDSEIEDYKAAVAKHEAELRGRGAPGEVLRNAPGEE